MFENRSHLSNKTKNTRFSRVRQWRASREKVAKRTTEAQELSREAVSRE